MTLKERLQADLEQAMKAQNQDERDTLRLLLAAIKQAEVDQQVALDDAGVEALLRKQAKQRQESIVAYGEAGRADLVEPEQVELEIIDRYLPQMMDRNEIEALARQVLAELQAEGPGAMGVVMGRLMPQLKGKADGRLVNEVVREILS